MSGRARRRAAAVSGVRSRWGEPNISKPTMNLRISAERSSGGIEVGVEVHGVVRLAVGGALVEAHGVGEADLEEIVVAGGDGFEDGREGGALGGGEGGEVAEVAAGKDEGLEGPGGPVGDEGDEEVVLDDDAGVGLREFGGEVVAEQAGVVLLVVRLLRGELAEGLVGDVFGGPDLAVGVRVAGAHHGAAVLEDLDVVDVGQIAEGGGFEGPGVDDGGDVGDGHAGEGEGVVGVEAEDAATAALGLGDEERGGVGRRTRAVRRGAARGSRCRRRRRICSRGCARRRSGRWWGRGSRWGRRRGRERWTALVVSPCQGRWVRCGETRIHWRSRGL